MAAETLVEMKGIDKYFPGVQALNSVDFEIYPGEVIGLVGENGAGKSTLMKVLMGIEKPDKGEIFVRGNKINIQNSQQAFKIGIGMVFQEQALIPNLRVCENIFLGREEEFNIGSTINWNKMNKIARHILDEIDFKLIQLNMSKN